MAKQGQPPLAAGTETQNTGARVLLASRLMSWEDINLVSSVVRTDTSSR